MAKKAPPKPMTLYTKPVPACKKWTRAAADARKKEITGKFRSMCRSGPVISSVKPDHLYLHGMLSFVEVVDITESSISQEEVDEGNQRLFESPPATKIGGKAGEDAEEQASPPRCDSNPDTSAALREGT